MKIKLFLLAMIVALLPLGLTAKTKARSKKKTTTTTQAAPAKKKLKITNSVELFFPPVYFEKIKIVDESEMKEIINIDEDGVSSEDYDEQYYDEADDETVDNEDENNYLEEVFYEHEQQWPAKNTITLILDTERDANGNAVRRHVYIYEGKEDALAENGRHIQGPNKIKRVSFPANNDGLEQWRMEIIKFFAQKNSTFLDEYFAIKKLWENGKIDDSNYNIKIRELQHQHAQDREAYRPCVLIKPMGNAESGDVIDAHSVMFIEKILSFTIQDVNHNDSVMIFNSLFPGKDMPSGVNFYSYGNIADYPQSFSIDIPENDLEFVMSELYFDPAVTIEVKDNQQHKGGAIASIMLDENKFREEALNSCPDLDEGNAPDLYVKSAKKERRRVKNALAAPTFKQLVQNYGNSVTEPKWFEVEPVNPHIKANKKNNIQQPIYDLTNISKAMFRGYGYNLWIYTDRHTPYSVLKCVIDNLQQININQFVIAY